jgi:hypothetical protein
MLTKLNKRVQTRGLVPVFDLIAFADGEFVPRKPYPSVRVFTRKGVARPQLVRVV